MDPTYSRHGTPIHIHHSPRRQIRNQVAPHGLIPCRDLATTLIDHITGCQAAAAAAAAVAQ